MGQDAEFTVYSQKSNNSSTIAKPLRIVIYDFPTLSQFPLIDLDVDFSSQMVLLAAMGPASSEQCSIHIDRVWRDGEHLRVEVSEHYPDPDAQRHPRAASPYHAVVVGRCELPIDGFTSRIPHGAFLR
ncbi:MAG: hypothetical protein GXP29_08485 [Planctomycetes bacterium]|nr:hypothetical protein [Planctomycetota bacterium]